MNSQESSVGTPPDQAPAVDPKRTPPQLASAAPTSQASPATLSSQQALVAPVPSPARSSAVEAEVFPPGLEGVDRQLEALAELPLAAHLDVLSQIHQQLTAALTTTGQPDQQAGTRDSQRNR